MLLEWIGAQRAFSAASQAGAAISRAVDRVLENPQTRTADLGGKLGTGAFGAVVAGAL